MPKVFQWIYGRNSAGRDILIGPYQDEAKSNSIAESLDDGQVFNLPTRNQGQATRIVKAKLADARGVYTEPIKNFMHAPAEGTGNDLAGQISNYPERVQRGDNGSFINIG